MNGPLPRISIVSPAVEPTTASANVSNLATSAPSPPRTTKASSGRPADRGLSRPPEREIGHSSARRSTTCRPPRVIVTSSCLTGWPSLSPETDTVRDAA